MASREEIQKLVESTDIVALVSEYVTLEKYGKNYKGLCPFHHEDTPSFVVNQEKKIAHCFGCGGGGDPIKFLMQIENLEYIHAIQKLAEKNGVKLSNTQVNNKPNPLTKYYQIMQTAQSFYAKYLENTKEGLEAIQYLNKRGLDVDTIKVFGIGLAPSNNNSLYQVLKESNYLELDMSDVALIDKNDRGYYDLFTKRIMFPVCNENGNVVAFSGRIFNSTDKNQAKYVNSRETIIFKKKDVLFNLNLAKGEILKKKRVILHEGQMDVIASYRSGLKEAVCSMGTAFSLEQAKMLKKYTNHAIICFDGDKAGIKASLKAINIFQSLNFTVHLVLLPNGSDPDEYVLNYGTEEYAKYFESNMIDANTYVFEQSILNKNFNDDTVRQSVKEEVFSLLSKINSQTTIEDFLGKLALKLNVSLDALKVDYQTYYNNINTFRNVEDVKTPIIYDEPIIAKPVNEETWNSICELRLIAYARVSKEKALYIDKMLEKKMDALSNENQMLWIKLINNYYENFEEFNEGYFIRLLTQSEYEHYQKIMEVLSRSVIKYNDEDLDKCLEALDIVQNNVQRKKMSNNINQSEDLSEQTYILSELFKKRKQKENMKKSRKNS